ncbi:MAG: flippase-like domain-containing protein [Syntrophobacterales bacterium]|nr:flippase-like domain-containing protein [Syntrophobacterales bacterium]
MSEAPVRRLTLVLLLVAGAFLFWMLAEVGWEPLAANLSRVGWGFPVLLLPYGVTTALDAYTWKRLLPDAGGRLGFLRLAALRLEGEALNVLTPTASLGGEPYKAAGLVNAGYSLEAAAASLVVHKALRVAGLFLYILLGLALAVAFLPEISPYLQGLLLGALVLGLGVAGFILVQRREPCQKAVRLLQRWHLCPLFLAAREAELARIDARLAAFYEERRGLAGGLVLVQLAAWAVNSLEVWLAFRLLEAPVELAAALIWDSLAMIFTALGFFLPASLGMQEGGNILLAVSLKRGAAFGAAFSILRRLREACWMGLGLVLALRRR